MKQNFDSTWRPKEKNKEEFMKDVERRKAYNKDQRPVLIPGYRKQPQSEPRDDKFARALWYGRQPAYQYTSAQIGGIKYEKDKDEQFRAADWDIDHRRANVCAEIEEMYLEYDTGEHED